MTRVAELQAEAAQKATGALSFEAVDLFRRFERDIADAKAAGDHKPAMLGRITMIEAFGYKDSPTLTHEHVLGKSLKAPEEKNAEQERQPTMRFAPILAELRRRKTWRGLSGS